MGLSTARCVSPVGGAAADLAAAASIAGGEAGLAVDGWLGALGAAGAGLGVDGVEDTAGFAPSAGWLGEASGGAVNAVEPVPTESRVLGGLGRDGALTAGALEAGAFATGGAGVAAGFDGAEAHGATRA